MFHCIMSDIIYNASFQLDSLEKEEWHSDVQCKGCMEQKAWKPLRQNADYCSRAVNTLRHIQRMTNNFWPAERVDVGGQAVHPLVIRWLPAVEMDLQQSANNLFNCGHAHQSNGHTERPDDWFKTHQIL